MLNGNLVSKVFSWLLAEKQSTAVCTKLRVKSGKVYRKWVPEVLGVNESESIEVRIRQNGFTATDFENTTATLDNRNSANYLFYVIPQAIQYDKVPHNAGILIPTGRVRDPFQCVKGAVKNHHHAPDKGLVYEASRKSGIELSAAIFEATELEKALTNLVIEINATND